ncbi:MAG TPA: hypothetical protein VFJ97_12885 [Dermatophilaceae bacterium]|nr:hypothetical protein [Dermatophilaceae bacterium]
MARSTIAAERSAATLPSPAARALGRRVAAIAVLLTGVALGLLVPAPPALAHGGEESTEGYLLVQQALGHLAHDTTPSGIDLAMEKVDDALAATDQEGVAIAEVNQAKSALEAGRVAQARALLQEAIQQAVSELPPATGNQTGTTVVAPELPGRAGLKGQDWAFLTASFVLLVVGVGLGVLLRPKDSIGVLRRRLAASRPAPGGDGSAPLGAAGGR